MANGPGVSGGRVRLRMRVIELRAEVLLLNLGLGGEGLEVHRMRHVSTVRTDGGASEELLHVEIGVVHHVRE